MGKKKKMVIMENKMVKKWFRQMNLLNK